MEATVRARMDNNWWWVQPPRDWYLVEGYIAVMDCTRVGEMTTISVYEREIRVLIADCAGDDGPPDRFSSRNIILEMDWRLWESLTGKWGRPLPVRLDGWDDSVALPATGPTAE